MNKTRLLIPLRLLFFASALVLIASVDNPAKKGTLDFTFNDLEGNPVSLSDSRFSGKVVYVDIWSTSCPASQVEMPLLVELFREYHAQGFEIIGIAFEPRYSHTENHKVLRDFVEDLEIPFTVLYGGRIGEAQKKLPQLKDYCERWRYTEAYPTGVFIGRDGEVKDVKTGIEPETTPDWLVSTIEELLDEGPHGVITNADVETDLRKLGRPYHTTLNGDRS